MLFDHINFDHSFSNLNKHTKQYSHAAFKANQTTYANDLALACSFTSTDTYEH